MTPASNYSLSPNPYHLNMKKEVKIIDAGYEIWETFLKVVKDFFGLKNLEVSNPTTYSAEMFYLLSKKPRNKELLLACLMREFADNFEDNIHAQAGKLYRIEKVKKSF